MIVTTTTITVSLIVKLGVGQETFTNSTLTSVKKSITRCIVLNLTTLDRFDSRGYSTDNSKLKSQKSKLHVKS